MRFQAEILKHKLQKKLQILNWNCRLNSDENHAASGVANRCESLRSRGGRRSVQSASSRKTRDDEGRTNVCNGTVPHVRRIIRHRYARRNEKMPIKPRADMEEQKSDTGSHDELPHSTQ